MQMVSMSEWIEVEYREIPEEKKEYTEEINWNQPCFYYNEEYWWLSDFIRCHGNPWGNMDVPDYIHGYDANNYFNPIFIQISDSGDFVKIFKKLNI